MAKMQTNDMLEVQALYGLYIQTVCYFVDLPAYCNKNKNYVSQWMLLIQLLDMLNKKCTLAVTCVLMRHFNFW